MRLSGTMSSRLERQSNVSTFRSRKNMTNSLRSPNKEVIVRLKGGIGNQLFEYAAARALALRNGADLKIDAISGFAYDHLYKRSLKLDQFSIQAAYASRRESFCDPMGRSRRMLIRALDRFRGPCSRRYIGDAEKNMSAEFRTLQFEGSLYLDGLWQNESYFSDYEKEIRADLTFKGDLPATASGIRSSIKSCQSVSVHVRRLFIPSGANALVPVEDHIPFPWLTRKPYYEAAIQSLSRLVSNPHFFIFSDYPEWARKNLRFPGKVTFLEERAGENQDVVDLRLMSMCKHHIISASTFSWWGAWLRGPAAGHVYTPREGWPFVEMPLRSWTQL